MAFEADRMANLVLTDEVVLPERDVILEERRIADRQRSRRPARRGGRRDALTATALRHADHRLGARDRAQLDREDALAFYERYYTPNNAILIVAGDVTEDEVRTLAERDLRQGAAPRRAAARVPRRGAGAARRRAP